MRQEQVENVTDKMNLPVTLSFSSRLVLSRRECKPDIKVNLSENRKISVNVIANVRECEYWYEFKG